MPSASAPPSLRSSSSSRFGSRAQRTCFLAWQAAWARSSHATTTSRLRKLVSRRSLASWYCCDSHSGVDAALLNVIATPNEEVAFAASSASVIDCGTGVRDQNGAPATPRLGSSVSATWR